MKKSIIITGLLSITPITHGFDQLAKTKEQISQAKKQISDTKGKLQTAYQDQKSSMLDNISKGMTSIAEQKNMLDQAYPISEALRATLAAGVIMPVVQIIAVPALAIAGDIPEILRSLSKTVNSIQSTLRTLDSNVRPKIEYLNPWTAPTLMQQFKTAVTTIQTAANAINALLPSLNADDENVKKFKESFAPIQNSLPTLDANINEIISKLALGPDNTVAMIKQLNLQATVTSIQTALTQVTSALSSLAGDTAVREQLTAQTSSIQTALNTFNSLLPSVTYLPVADAKGIYKQADVAIAAFVDVETKIDEMLSLLQSLSGE